MISFANPAPLSRVVQSASQITATCSSKASLYSGMVSQAHGGPFHVFDILEDMFIEGQLQDDLWCMAHHSFSVFRDFCDI